MKGLPQVAKCQHPTEGKGQAGPPKLPLLRLKAEGSRKQEGKRRERREWRKGRRGIGHIFGEPRLAFSKGLTPFARGVGHAKALSKQWSRSPLFGLASSSEFPGIFVWAVTSGFSRGSTFCCHSSGW